jgi:hypothetical protein
MAAEPQDAMAIEAALPQLLTNYRRGVLVPFIGSGMSRPACAGWIPFRLALAQRASCTITPELQQALDQKRASSTELYRLADLCVRRLKARGRDALVTACRQALQASADAPVPRQTSALAEIAWPLVLSTNYDDLLLRAAYDRHEAAVAEGALPAVLPPLFELAGQSVQDCHIVLRSLDAVTPPLLWTLQGYLGGRRLTQTPIEESRAERLEREVVIGHQQYQAVINAQPHLRRAVAEVFRRRSLLFLGSGVQEDYLINLFSEIIHHHGTSAYTHFAVFHQDQQLAIDVPFFRLRLGIEPLFVADHAAIPALLTRLRNNLSIHDVPDPHERVFSCAPYELALRFPAGDGGQGGFTLRLRHDGIGWARGTTECVGVSVGRSAAGPILGRMAKTALQRAMVAESAWHDWQRQDDDGYVYRHATEQRLFVIAARAPNDGGDQRHLQVIPSALAAFLACVDREGFETATIGLLAAGRGRPWPALYPFVMMLAAIREFGRSRPARLRELVVSVVEPTVWYPLLAGKIAVERLLSADTATVWVHVVGEPDDELESYALTMTSSTTVADVARQCGLPPGTWKVSVYPVPHGDHRHIANAGELAVVPGASVTFTAAAADGESLFVHAG